MKIINEFPPNFEDIARKFDFKDLKPVFTYGDKIYNPSAGHISEDLLKHEEVHERQQGNYGSVQDWWLRYLNDDIFRMSQELEAYRTQYKFVVDKGTTRDIRRQFLQDLAKNFSSKLYGNIINKNQALEFIKNHA